MSIMYKFYKLFVRATKRICCDISGYNQKLNLKYSGVHAHWDTMKLYGRNIWDIKPGADVEFGETFVCTGGANLTIDLLVGSKVYVSAGCLIMDSDFHDLDYRKRRINHGNKTAKCYPIQISDDVFIGARCIICKGVTIGERSIVAAGSVVRQNIPADEIWGGNPATFIKKINIE